jgi:hypothetical protein
VDSVLGSKCTKESERVFGVSQRNLLCGDAVQFTAANGRKNVGTGYVSDRSECVSGHIAMDGKTINGTSWGGVSTVHLLSLFLMENESVTNQMAVEPGENEITTALRLLENSTMDGKIITGDAIFSQKKKLRNNMMQKKRTIYSASKIITGQCAEGLPNGSP